MTENKRRKASLKERLIEAGAEPKKVILYLLILDLLCFGFGIYFYFSGMSIAISVVSIAIAPIFDYYAIIHLLRGKNKKDVGLETEFVRIFGYLNVYLQDKIPVYTSLNNILAFASPNMAERLKKLIEQIDQDKSVAPYIAFSNQFPSLLIKEVMVSLYLISEQGGIEVYMPQFQKSFDALSTQKRQADKEQRLSTLNTLCFLPLVGSGASMLMIVAGIVTLMRSMTNGI